MAQEILTRGSYQEIPVDISAIYPDPENGPNLTGGKAYLTVKPEASVDGDTLSDDAAVLKVDLVIAEHPSDGIITFPIEDDALDDATPGEYVWGAQVKGSDNKPVEIKFNPRTVTIEGDITRRRD